MKTYEYQLEDRDNNRRDTVVATEEQLREAGLLAPGLTELEWYLRMWDLADKLAAENG